MRLPRGVARASDRGLPPHKIPTSSLAQRDFQRLHGWRPGPADKREDSDFARLKRELRRVDAALRLVRGVHDDGLGQKLALRDFALQTKREMVRENHGHPQEHRRREEEDAAAYATAEDAHGRALAPEILYRSDTLDAHSPPARRAADAASSADDKEEDELGGVGTNALRQPAGHLPSIAGAGTGAAAGSIEVQGAYGVIEAHGAPEVLDPQLEYELRESRDGAGDSGGAAGSASAAAGASGSGYDGAGAAPVRAEAVEAEIISGGTAPLPSRRVTSGAPAVAAPTAAVAPPPFSKRAAREATPTEDAAAASRPSSVRTWPRPPPSAAPGEPPRAMPHLRRVARRLLGSIAALAWQSGRARAKPTDRARAPPRPIVV